LSGIAHAEASRPFWDVPLDRLRADAVCRYGKGQIPLGIPGFRSP